MSDPRSGNAAEKRFSTTAPLLACQLRRNDLARLYTIINDKQIEYGKTLITQYPQTPNESTADYQTRRAKIEDAFVTTVSVTGSNREVVTGVGEDFLNSVNIPEDIVQVFYSTTTRPSATFPGLTPLNRATVLLDFSRPPALDMSRFPTLATPNVSNYEIFAENESWFTALNSRLTQFFHDRRTNHNWIHRPGTYDFLLIVAGLPCAIWLDYRLSKAFNVEGLPTLIKSGVYVYAFFGVLYLFRLLFSYSRWVFPLVEIRTDTSSPLRHRTAWAAVMIAIVGSMAWDAIKGLW